jgi:hypothetical protein
VSLLDLVGTCVIFDMRCRAKSNQESPLLRLPPEIRNKIWGYTLGHNIFRSILIRLGKRKFKYEWMSRPDEPHIGLPLLATCRQIYSEAAIMPFNLNTFVADTLNGERNMLRAFKVFNAHQRKQITSIRLVYKSYDLLGSDALNDFNVYQLEGYRAQLKRLHSKLNTMEFVILSGEVEYLSEEGVAHI